MPLRFLRAALVLLGTLAGLAGMPAHAALFTILDGEAVVVTDRATLVAAAGLALPRAALVHVSPAAALARLEWPDGSSLDLGPDARVLVLAGGLPGGRGPGVYLLRGTAKLTSAKADTAPVMSTAAAELEPFAGVAVVKVLGTETGVFAETGALRVSDRGTRPPLAVANGQFYIRNGAAKGQVQPRPPSDLLPKLPRAFRDTLPRLHDRMAGRTVNPRTQALPAFDELAPWLSEPALRRVLVNQFAAWSRDDTVRSVLIARVNQYREWAPLVLPRPENPPAGAGTAPADGGARPGYTPPATR
ncbi:MAG: hypothetical protein ACOVQT_13240 [Rubrivivax sp.]|jgi:hypothetical protein